MKINGVAMLTVILSAVAAQAFTSGDGTAGNPYQISTRQDLEAVSNDLSAHYILMNDIDLAGITYTQAVISPDTSTDWEFQGTPFTGSFNGNGYAVKNLKISASTTDYIGMFGRIDLGACVSNLGIINCDITGSWYVGGLCGWNEYGTITSSYATGEVSGGYYVGGLCGRNYYGTITSSYTTGKVSGSRYIGGLCGFSESGTITSSYSIGAVTGDDYSVGGLCGHNGGTITSCYATGTVIGSGSVGGLCGWNNYYCSITSSYATGEVSGSYDVGGLCGANEGTITSSYSTGAVTGADYCVGGLCGSNYYNGTIISSYATGTVTGSGSYIGGLAGYNDGVITASFWDMQTSGQAESQGGTGLTTAQMQAISTFTNAGWDFVNEDANGQMELWYMPQGDYPRLYWQAAAGDIDYDGQITQGDLIALAAQWLTAAKQNQRLTADINQDGNVNLKDYRAIAEIWPVQ